MLLCVHISQLDRAQKHDVWIMVHIPRGLTMIQPQSATVYVHLLEGNMIRKLGYPVRVGTGYTSAWDLPEILDDFWEL